MVISRGPRVLGKTASSIALKADFLVRTPFWKGSSNDEK